MKSFAVRFLWDSTMPETHTRVSCKCRHSVRHLFVRGMISEADAVWWHIGQFSRTLLLTWREVYLRIFYYPVTDDSTRSIYTTVQGNAESSFFRNSTIVWYESTHTIDSRFLCVITTGPMTDEMLLCNHSVWGYFHRNASSWLVFKKHFFICPHTTLHEKSTTVLMKTRLWVTWRKC